jgi:hypothetical protein
MLAYIRTIGRERNVKVHRLRVKSLASIVVDLSLILLRKSGFKLVNTGVNKAAPGARVHGPIVQMLVERDEPFEMVC